LFLYPFTDGYYSRQKEIPYPSPVKVFAENTSRACEAWRFSAKPAKRLDLAGKKGYGITFAAG
jgi:hypothetical protein